MTPAAETDAQTRAIDDPETLARAARIVRTALARRDRKGAAADDRREWTEAART